MVQVISQNRLSKCYITCNGCIWIFFIFISLQKIREFTLILWDICCIRVMSYYIYQLKSWAFSTANVSSILSSHWWTINYFPLKFFELWICRNILNIYTTCIILYWCVDDILDIYIWYIVYKTFDQLLKRIFLWLISSMLCQTTGNLFLEVL